MAIRYACFSLFLLCCYVDATGIRRNNQPYMYKALHVGRPALFPSEIPSQRTLTKKENMMVVGTAPDDLQIDSSNRQTSVASPSLQLNVNPTPMEEAENTLEGFLKVMNMTEGSNAPKDPLMKNLTEIADEMDQTTNGVMLRTSSSTPNSNETAREFIQRVRDLLAASGIEAVLPLDCGRNPLSISGPLDNEPLPWIAALGSREDGRFHYRCTGAIISQYHIITDAECVTSPNVNVAQLNVTGFVPEPFAVKAFVVGRRIHPSVTDEDSLLDGNNIGILELANPLTFNDYVQPICLPGVFDKADPDEIDTSVAIIGFDNINDTPEGRRAGVYVWPNSKLMGAAACYSAIRRFNKQNPDETSNLFSIITKNHMCVDRPFEEVGKSVVVKEDAVTGRVRLLGVGPVANARKTNPIAYTLVQPHRFWIELVLKKFIDNTNRVPEGLLILT